MFCVFFDDLTNLFHVCWVSLAPRKKKILYSENIFLLTLQCVFTSECTHTMTFSTCKVVARFTQRKIYNSIANYYTFANFFFFFEFTFLWLVFVDVRRCCCSALAHFDSLFDLFSRQISKPYKHEQQSKKGKVKWIIFFFFCIFKLEKWILCNFCSQRLSLKQNWSESSWQKTLVHFFFVLNGI